MPTEKREAVPSFVVPETVRSMQKRYAEFWGKVATEILGKPSVGNNTQVRIERIFESAKAEMGSAGEGDLLALLKLDEEKLQRAFPDGIEAIAVTYTDDKGKRIFTTVKAILNKLRNHRSFQKVASEYLPKQQS